MGSHDSTDPSSYGIKLLVWSGYFEMKAQTLFAFYLMFAVMEIFDGITTVADLSRGFRETNGALLTLAGMFEFNPTLIAVKSSLLIGSTLLLYLALRSDKVWERRLVGGFYWVFAAISLTAVINNVII